MKIPENWSFDAEGVAKSFDHHVREQLPWYDLVTGGIAHIARHYLPEGGRLYDVGASTGNLANVVDDLLTIRRASYIGIERSAKMLAQWQANRWTPVLVDALAYDYAHADVVVLNLVLMFLPTDVRGALLRRILDALVPGGVMIVVDKTPAVTGYPATVLWRMTLAGKVSQGATPQEIIEKELSLSGIQRPLDSALLPYNAVQWFRFGDFAGWLIEKPQA